MTISLIILLITSMTFLVSCNQGIKQNEGYDKYNKKNRLIKLSDLASEDNPEIYVKITKPRDGLLNTIITINRQNISLINAISEAMPDINIKINDNKVNLKKVISIRYKGNFENFLTHLSTLTGYHIELVGTVIHLSAQESRSWNLAALSINTSGADINQVTGHNLNKNWAKIISDIEKLLSKDATIIDNQQTGDIYVVAQPKEIILIDKFIKNTIIQAESQINLDITILDVLINKSSARGIDWSLVSEGSNGVIGIDGEAIQSIDGAGQLSLGTLNPNRLLNKGDVSVKLLINLLEKQGNVSIKNQPNITVTNGNQAYVSTGDEFSYVASINSNTDQSGNVTSNAQIKRLKVGVELQVTAKILTNDRVLVNVLPIISSLQSFTTIASSAQSFQTPNIALQKLSTQVIVKNKSTIRLGGLIAERIANASKFLPDSKPHDDFSILGFLFDSNSQALEKREIVILIKPTIL